MVHRLSLRTLRAASAPAKTLRNTTGVRLLQSSRTADCCHACCDSLCLSKGAAVRLTMQLSLHSHAHPARFAQTQVVASARL